MAVTKTTKEVRTADPFVFISHDSRDAVIAELFSELLRKSSAGILKCFFSPDPKGRHGLVYGEEWYQALMKKLLGASNVVCLLTPRSLERPWILYEAGVARGRFETTVFGIALGIPIPSTGPFAQLQNCADDEASLTTLVVQLVKRIHPNADPNRTQIGDQVRTFKNKALRILTVLEREDHRADYETFRSLGMQMVYRRLDDERLPTWLSNAKDIQVLKTWFPETRDIKIGLKNGIRGGAKVSLLLCKPNSILLRRRSRNALDGREWLGPNIVYQTVKAIHNWIPSASADRVEVGLYDSWPGCPVIWCDEKILMGFYFRGAHSPWWPWVSVEKGSYLAGILNDQFIELWDDPKTIRLKTQKEREEWLKKNEKFARPLAPSRAHNNRSSRTKSARKDKR